MTVHDHIKRAVDGHRRTREDAHAAAVRDADEILARHELAGSAIDPDEVHSISPATGDDVEHTT